MARTDWATGDAVTAAAMNAIGAEINALDARVSALEAPPVAAEAVTITTTGSTFSPRVVLASGSTATVHWDWSGGTTTGLTPTINFGSPGTRTVSMTVLDGVVDAIGEVESFILGYDHTQDTGDFMPASSLDHTAQAVTGVGNVHAMTGLVNFLASCPNLGGSIDFSGMADLEFIECFQADVTGVTLTGCTSLIRLDLEECNVATLDLNPVRTTLRDLRSARQRGGLGVTFTPLSGGGMTQLYHYCVRDQTVTNHFTMAQLPNLRELWNWNSGQTGTLALNGTASLYELRSYDNNYSTLSGIPGSTGLRFVDFHSNDSFDQTDVDGIINAVEALGTSGPFRTLDLTGTSTPSSGEAADITALRGRSWTVNVDTGTATVPGTPTGLSLAAANTQLTLSWTAPASNGGSAITSYTVRYRVTGGGSYTTITGVTASPRVITGLTNGTVHNVSVAAVNAIGTGSYATDVNGTPTGVLFSDDFHRADAANLAAVNNGWTSPDGVTATITSNVLNKTSSAGYQRLLNSGGVTLPADYSVEVTYPGENHSYFFVVGRYASGTGVRVGWESSSTTTGFSGLIIGDASGPGTGNVTVTADSAFPSSWSVVQPHTVRIQMVGSLINVYCDGVLVGHGTCTINQSATGTSFGISGGFAETYHQVTVT